MQELTYLFDPMCGWCYGAEPTLRQVGRVPGISLRLVPTGTFAFGGGRRLDRQMAAHIWAADQRIHALSGQVFSDAYRTRVLGSPDARLASAAATLALTAVAETDAEAEFDALAAIQTARYVGGLDITSDPVLADCLQGLGLAAAARLFTERPADLIDRNNARIAQGAAELRRHGLSGVPALLLGRPDRRLPLDSALLYEKPAQLIALVANHDIATIH